MSVLTCFNWNHPHKRIVCSLSPRLKVSLHLTIIMVQATAVIGQHSLYSSFLLVSFIAILFLLEEIKGIIFHLNTTICIALHQRITKTVRQMQICGQESQKYSLDVTECTKQMQSSINSLAYESNCSLQWMLSA